MLHYIYVAANVFDNILFGFMCALIYCSVHGQGELYEVITLKASQVQVLLT